jgi:hypothetical protein
MTKGRKKIVLRPSGWKYDKATADAYERYVKLRLRCRS